MEITENEGLEKLKKETDDEKKKEWQLYFHAFYQVYMKELEEDKQEWAEAKRLTEQYLLSLADRCEEVFSNLYHQDDCLSEAFLAEGSEDEKKEAREELLQETALSRKDFGAIALASQAKKPLFVQNAKALFSRKKHGELPHKSFFKEGTAEADDAIAQYYLGKPEKLERIISDDLNTACNEFYKQEDPEIAMQWAHHVNTLVSITATHKTLFRNGLQAPLLERAAKVATMGKIMEHGMESLAALKQIQIGAVSAVQETKARTEAEIILMCEVENQRSKEAARLGLRKNRIMENPGIPTLSK